MTAEEATDISPAGDKGVLKKIIKAGSGEVVPAVGCLVTVHYTGTLLDGTKFDSSKDRNEPFEFNLGKGSVIKAWDIGVATMRRGEVCLLTCAPEYAYGDAGSPPKIPPKSTLQFEIEMISWKGEDISSKKDGGIERYILTAGTGFDQPKDGSLVNVEIVGRLPGVDEPFESRSVSFTLGEGSEEGIIEGVETALEHFIKGEKSRIVIQPKYAFRSEGNASLKVPPNSVVEYTVTLTDFEKAKESWSLTEPEKLEQAKLYKDKGTLYFKAAKYLLAIKMYEKVVSLLQNEQEIKEQGEKGEGSVLLVSSHLNLSLSHAKLLQHERARHHAAQALTLQPQNVKALFRRGQAHAGLGDADKALLDFQQVLQLEPDNKAAANQVILCNAALKQQRDKERQLYANMFEKFADKDREAERIAAAARPDVMAETLGEWGRGAGEGEWSDAHRNRKPTHFELENPNILMLDKDGQFENM